MKAKLLLLPVIAAMVVGVGVAPTPQPATAFSTTPNSLDVPPSPTPPAASASEASSPALAVRQQIATTRLEIGANASIADVARTTTGFVAVGRTVRETNTGLVPAATSWTSTDGRTWKKAPASTALRNAQMFSVAVIGSRIVAVGLDWATNGGAVWTSTNGRTWRRVATGTLFASTWLKQVVADGSRFAVTGIRYRGPADLRDPVDKVIGSRIWVSTTGERWLYVSGTATVLVGARVHTLLSVPNGLIAAGDFGRPLGQSYAAAWSSPNNGPWRPSVSFPTGRESRVGALGAVGDRIIAFGANGATNYSLAAEGGNVKTGQGRRWQPISDPDIAPDKFCATGFYGRAAVGPGADGLVAIGTCTGTADQIAWSLDGVEWSVAPLDLPGDGSQALAVIRDSKGLIVVGFEAGASTPLENALVWLVPDPTA